MNKKFDLEERLIAFSIKIMNIAENLPNSKSGTYISNQIIRSGSSPALNYAEAQSAESRNDFVHKMKICLIFVNYIRTKYKISTCESMIFVLMY